MMKYGSKDLMRIQDIRSRAGGVFLEEIALAVRMANEIEQPGKAMARGYAAQEVYKSHYSPIAAVFFERAQFLGGDDVKPVASMNPVKDEESVEDAYANVPTEKQPASRRPNPITSRAGSKSALSMVSQLGRINVVKGTGQGFDAHYYKWGTVEVWKNEDGKNRLVYTSNSEPNYGIGEERNFKIDNDKVEKWTMADYIEVSNMINLMPLYGTSIYGYRYE